jgi:hypothetical protein
MRSLTTAFTIIWMIVIGLNWAQPAAAQSWSTHGPAGATITALAVHPWTPTTLYAGTTGGIFKSTTGGTEWQRSGPPPVVVLSLAIDPLAPSTGGWHWTLSDDHPTLVRTMTGDLHVHTTFGIHKRCVPGAPDLMC